MKGRVGAATLLGRILTGWLLDRFFGPQVAFCLLATSALGVFLLSEARSAGWLCGCRSYRPGYGRGGRRHSLPYLQVFRSPVVLHTIGAHLDCLRNRHRHRPGDYGQSIRRDGFLCIAAALAFVDYRQLRFTDVALPRYERRSLPQSELSVVSSGN